MPNLYCGNCLASGSKTRAKFTTLDELMKHIGEHLAQQKAGVKEPLATISESPVALALLLESVENPPH